MVFCQGLPLFQNGITRLPVSCFLVTLLLPVTERSSDKLTMRKHSAYSYPLHGEEESMYKNLIKEQFKRMWASYPHPDKHRDLIDWEDLVGGTVGENLSRAEGNPKNPYYNTCAVRMSYTLNQSGVLILPYNRNDDLELEAGSNKKFYYSIKAHQLRNYLVKIFGPPLPIELKRKGNFSDIEQTKNDLLGGGRNYCILDHTYRSPSP